MTFLSDDQNDYDTCSSIFCSLLISFLRVIMRTFGLCFQRHHSSNFDIIVIQMITALVLCLLYSELWIRTKCEYSTHSLSILLESKVLIFRLGRLWRHTRSEVCLLTRIASVYCTSHSIFYLNPNFATRLFSKCCPQCQIILFEGKCHPTRPNESPR